MTARRCRAIGRLALRERLGCSLFRRPANFPEQMLARNRKHRYNAIRMNDPSQIGRPAPRRSAALRARAEAYAIRARCFSAGRGDQKNLLGPGGPRNPLKRLDSAKEIQGKPCLFL